ncbi:MAG: hypothetical protein IJG38_05020 [Thermoguttaceae bacterium]|nr:hypothetical protein [Thermoguttaceae bacterium]
MEKENEGFTITKINRYYDTEYDIEYFDMEINGDKPDPEADTVEINAETKPKPSDTFSLYDLRWCRVK